MFRTRRKQGEGRPGQGRGRILWCWDERGRTERPRPRNTRLASNTEAGPGRAGEGLLSQLVSRGACAVQPRVNYTQTGWGWERWDLLLFIFIGRQWNDIIIKSRLFSWTALYVSVINHKFVIKIKNTFSPQQYFL